MAPTKFNYRQFFLIYFEPLIKHPFLTISASLIIGLSLFVGVDIILAEVVRQNSYPIQMLATEQLIELGPDYIDESRRYEKMITQYTEYLEQRNYAGILRILYPTLSPQKVLASTKKALGKATKEEAEETIWQAGLATNKLYMRSRKFPRSSFQWFESEIVPDELLNEVDDAFHEFHEQVNNLKKAQNLEAAEKECRIACRYSRRVVLLLFIARLGYDNEEKKMERFISDVERARKLAHDFAERAGKKKDEKKQQVFLSRARNMNLRGEVVKAMLANDMNRASNLLRNVIEIALKAFEKEKANIIE